MGQTFASGIWWNDHAFGYQRGLHWDLPLSWFVVAFFVIHMVRTARSERRHRGTPRGAALLARGFLAGVFGFVLLAAWFAANTGVWSWLHGSPIRNAVPWLIFALLGAYQVWQHAVQHHIPARILLGPGWWIHRWAAELEPRA
jgi:hypothetical protein